MLALAAAVCLLGMLAYGLLMVSSPTNILILGIDRRPGEGNAVRTDTILMLHADPGSRRLVLLSIPRDLWVTIPGIGEERINAAHVYGELAAPGSGPARVAETISHNFGVPVNRNLRLDFDAFREVIDAAGGIELDVPTTIIDDAYPTNDYGTVRIEIPAGLQKWTAKRPCNTPVPVTAVATLIAPPVNSRSLSRSQKSWPAPAAGYRSRGFIRPFRTLSRPT